MASMCVLLFKCLLPEPMHRNQTEGHQNDQGYQQPRATCAPYGVPGTAGKHPQSEEQPERAYSSECEPQPLHYLILC